MNATLLNSVEIFIYNDITDMDIYEGEGSQGCSQYKKNGRDVRGGNDGEFLMFEWAVHQVVSVGREKCWGIAGMMMEIFLGCLWGFF